MTQANTITYEEPRNPNRIVGMSYFLTTIGAGILFAGNWKRLGKPAWSRPTLILSIAAGTVAIGIIIGLIAFLTSLPFQRNLIWLLFPGIGLAFGINFGYMFTILFMQNPAYKKWKKEGNAAMLAHSYNVQRSIIFFIVCVVLSVIAFTVLYTLTNGTSSY